MERFERGRGDVAPGCSTVKAQRILRQAFHQDGQTPGGFSAALPSHREQQGTNRRREVLQCSKFTADTMHSSIPVPQDRSAAGASHAEAGVEE